eukprot:SAG31_NODE_2699_length_5225_cov_2.190987_5_plen_175_part_00
MLKLFSSIVDLVCVAHFSEHLTGVPTLRAFGDVKRAIDTNTDLLSTNLLTAFYQRQVHGWVSFRLDLFGAMLTLAATLSCVWFRTSLSPAVVGLMLLQLRQAIQYYRWTAKISVDMESKMVYVERVLQYIDLPTEPPLHFDNDPSPFPRDGEIDFVNVSLRYRCVISKSALSGE